MQKIAIPCVILAGGKSSRLGTDKTQIAFGQHTLSQWVFMRLSVLFESLYISAKTRDKFQFEAPFLIESSSIYAPMVGMINAFKKLDTQEIMFLSVDTPFITCATLHNIALANAPIVYAQSAHKAHYLISKWHKSMLDTLIWAYKAKNYALHRIIESHPYQSIAATEEECLNINTMDDYREALKVYEDME
ncbi:molybdenum cofactor guanylyltransferase MobA [Helicobacter sp. MIT 21-1697]|uniref:molybdenum cofactor guanylyltransferase MobA n=1 Tax=Helicobacter sp. MIT 21-1697 TaxID=2993733 RepID=UPI00224B6692|nr:molybdenum cofactor guanylyltransferase MobA [Helicobacter sp. MIT 21-1697]MCX2717736.1 molybdenum cofactor guanylyltransferase MobA [Helicobacter sp. MIT 21-1697]